MKKTAKKIKSIAIIIAMMISMLSVFPINAGAIDNGSIINRCEAEDITSGKWGYSVVGPQPGTWNPHHMADKVEGSSSIILTSNDFVIPAYARRGATYPLGIDIGNSSKQKALQFYIKFDDINNIRDINVELGTTSYDADVYTWNIEQFKDGNFLKSNEWVKVTLPIYEATVTGTPTNIMNHFGLLIYPKEGTTITFKFDEVKVVSLNEIVVNNCDTRKAGWASSAPTDATIDTADKQEGAASVSYSLTGGLFTFQKNAATVKYDLGNIYDKALQFWYYIDDVSKLAASPLSVELASGGGPDVAEFQWDTAKSSLVSGWNKIEVRLSNPATNSNPNTSAIDWVRIYCFINDGVTANIKIDAIKIITLSNASINNCDTPKAGWNQAPVAGVADAADKQEGAASLSFALPSANMFVYQTPNNSAMTYNLGNIYNKGFEAWLYLSDASRVESTVNIELASGGGADANEFQWSISKNSLVNGWNKISIKLTDEKTSDTNPNVSAINWVRFFFPVTDAITIKLDDMKIVTYPSETTATIDDFNAATLISNWVTNANISIDTTDKKEGASSVKINAPLGTTTFQTVSNATKYYNFGDVANKRVEFWFYVETAGSLSSLNLELSSAGQNDVNEKEWFINVSHFGNGWNKVILPFNSSSTELGNCDTTAINWVRFYYTTTAATVIGFDEMKLEYLLIPSFNPALQNIEVTQGATKAWFSGFYDATLAIAYSTEGETLQTGTVVTITHKDASIETHTFVVLPTNITLINGSIYGIKTINSGKYLFGVDTFTENTNLMGQFNDTGYLVAETVADKTYVGTGCKVTLVVSNATVDTVEVITMGDVSGDGNIDASDLIKIKINLLKIQQLAGAYKIAGNLYNNADISVKDLLAIKKHILGISFIQQSSYIN